MLASRHIICAVFARRSVFCIGMVWLRFVRTCRMRCARCGSNLGLVAVLTLALGIGGVAIFLS
jgi:hypothetical protein